MFELLLATARLGMLKGRPNPGSEVIQLLWCALGYYLWPLRGWGRPPAANWKR